MQPKLAVLSGPLLKSEFPVAAVLSIGRNSSNSICLEDTTVSPVHCRISCDNERSLLVDLDSDSGTFVNGIPVKQRVLAPGDQIAIGSSLFIFEVERTPAPARSAVQLDEDPATGTQVQQLRKDELVYLHPDSLAALPQPARLARALGTLVKISTAIGSIRDVESLQWQLLGMIFDVIPAERGAILLVEDTAEEAPSPVAWDRVAGPDNPVHVNLALTRRVIDEGISVLENESPRLDVPDAPDQQASKIALSALL